MKQLRNILTPLVLFCLLGDSRNFPAFAQEHPGIALQEQAEAALQDAG